MNDNRSVATIDNPEFINLEPYNPLISQCQIKVLYLGRNRNGSFIDKNTAIQMANSLPGCPIVGAWREDIEDFGDHGHVMTIEDNQIKFSCKTRPYGFVAPDARVWFQKFTDTDDFGEEQEREYMMTTGYLWTGQYQEAMSVIEEGKGQSMELDPDHLDGKWANDSKTGMDFFIINDAIFSKLCILGDDVEPCFEGASVTGVEDNFTENADFAKSLYTMIKELQDALGTEGGLNMPEPEDFVATSVEEQEVEQHEVEETAEEEVVETEEAEVETDESEESESEEDDDSAAADDADADFVQKKEEDEEDAPAEEQPAEEEEEDKKKKVADNACGDRKKRYELDESEFAAIKEELEELRQFKRSIENKEKDALIAKYFMLSDEEKSEVVAHKEEYSLDQIEEKLALIYVKKNVDFTTIDGKQEIQEQVEPVVTFSLDEDGTNAEVVDSMQETLRQVVNFYA